MKIMIDRDIAWKWADEMLAQAKYARLSPQCLVDLLNEIRKDMLINLSPSEKECTCGEPEDITAIHRIDDPCYVKPIHGKPQEPFHGDIAEHDTMTTQALAEHLGVPLWIVMEIARWEQAKPQPQEQKKEIDLLELYYEVKKLKDRLSEMLDRRQEGLEEIGEEEAKKGVRSWLEYNGLTGTTLSEIVHAVALKYLIVRRTK